MKTVMTLGIAALLATAGAAAAGEPMVLTDAQMDSVTAGKTDLTLPNGKIVAQSAVKGSIEVKTELNRILIGLSLPNGKELMLPAVQTK
jgi:hypothetical protein